MKTGVLNQNHKNNRNTKVCRILVVSVSWTASSNNFSWHNHSDQHLSIQIPATTKHNLIVLCFNNLNNFSLKWFILRKTNSAPYNFLKASKVPIRNLWYLYTTRWTSTSLAIFCLIELKINSQELRSIILFGISLEESLRSRLCHISVHILQRGSNNLWQWGLKWRRILGKVCHILSRDRCLMERTNITASNVMQKWQLKNSYQ